MQNYILNEEGHEARGDGSDFAALKAHELCVFHLRRLGVAERHRSFIQSAVARSSMVVLSLPASVTFEPGFHELIRSFPGLYAISVRFPLAAEADPRYVGSPLPGREGDLRVVDYYRKLVDDFRFDDGEPVRVIPEIEITDELQLLGPTLMALSRFSPPWLVLAVEGAPTKRRAAALRDCFEYLQMRKFPLLDIHFSFENEFFRSWVAQSDCFFAGPEEFHIDLSNRCTHSCVYCALYAPAIIDDLKATNRLDEGMRKFMSAQLDADKAVELIRTLPVTTRLVQFGGAGDPMLHPKALELITHLRERAVTVEVLSNMEYLKEPDLEKLNALGGKIDHSLKFIVNISAATPETYVRTRPRQTPAVFQKVVASLRRLSELREKSGGLGVHFTMMCVVNRLNYHEATRYVELAKEVGAAYVWFKPLEIHHRFHYDLLPAPEERAIYARALRNGLERADQLGVSIVDRDTLEETIRSNEKAAEARA